MPEVVEWRVFGAPKWHAVLCVVVGLLEAVLQLVARRELVEEGVRDFVLRVAVGHRFIAVGILEPVIQRGFRINNISSLFHV